jgi:hypothetical protein
MSLKVPSSMESVKMWWWQQYAVRLTGVVLSKEEEAHNEHAMLW